MSNNKVQPGITIAVILAAAKASGALVLIGQRVGVAETAGGIGDTVECAVKGVYSVPKLSSDVVAQGALLYLDNTNARLTTTSSGNTLAGYAVEAAGNGVATVKVHLNA